MSSLSNIYIKDIEQYYYLNNKPIILNSDHKKMIESFCDNHISIILKNRIVGSTITICLFICEYLIRNGGRNVLYKHGYSYNSTVRIVGDFIKNMTTRIRPSISINKDKRLKLLFNDSKLFEYPTSIRGFEPDLIYLSDLDGLNNKKVEKIFDDLSDLWNIGIKPKIIIEHKNPFILGGHERFNKFLEKSKNNSNVNIVHVTNGIIK